MIKLKICGMREPANIDEVASLAPDYMGFIFYNKTPRYVGDAFRVSGNFPASVKKVGVFVNETTPVIRKRAHDNGIDIVQLHGSETAAQCTELQAAGLTTIKVFSVDDSFDFAATKPYRSVVDYFLFDTKGKYHGGNAKTFDWSILQRYDQELPFFLSGGLSPDNISSIVSLAGMNIHALDLNSGVEISPGFKDIGKITDVKHILNTTFKQVKK